MAELIEQSTGHLDGLSNGLHDGFRGLASVFVLAAFAAGGTETVGIAAGEAQAPKWVLPRAIRALMWRIAIFYIISTLFLSFVVPYNLPDLVDGSNANSSPFVIAIKKAGIKALPDILNAIVALCVCSVGSTSIYISSRTLQGMAEDGLTWKVFARTDQHGRPYPALIFTGCVGIALAYLNVSNTGSTVFSWFSSISGMAFFIAWLVIIACSMRFRAALKAQNDNVLQEIYAFRALGWPWLPIFAFAAISFMILCQFIVSIFPIGQKPSARYFFSQFIGLPVFLVMWLGYKIICGTTTHKLDSIDLQTGRRDMDEEEMTKFAEYESWSKRRRALSYLQF